MGLSLGEDSKMHTVQPRRAVLAAAAALCTAAALWLTPASPAHSSTAPPPPSARAAGGRVAFVDERNVVSMWADGTHRREANVRGYPFGVNISRDGRWMAFTVQPDGLLSTDPNQVW